MRVHIIDEVKSTEERLISLCGGDLSPTIRKGMVDRQFLTYPNQLHLVDCQKCLKMFAKKHA